jgi:protein O-GlcNAcase/histone acetyltransferase
MASTSAFLSGVIEGFYGPPWTVAERLRLFEWMAQWGLNTYLYAPKDDLKHRALWRELYAENETVELKKLIQAASEHGLRFVYGISPGLDIRYSKASEPEQLKRRFEQMLELGCRHFSLLFDDIPDRLDAVDLDRWGSLADAQAAVANELFRWTRARAPYARFLFCPTPYCGRMRAAKLGGEDYLPTLGKELAPEIDVFWTGPDIISREITPAHIRELAAILSRKPVIWDNLHANDYDGRRFFCGPYSGRTPELLGEVNGLLSNPNCEFPLNYVPLRTLAEFVRARGKWDARRAYLQALLDWSREFTTVNGKVDPEDLILLGDCYYLPHEEGPAAQQLYNCARDLLSRPPSEWGEQAREFRRQAARLRQLCTQLAALRNRLLFHALNRRLWELREELDLLDRGIEHNENGGAKFAPFTSDYHLPGTYRGGFVARLQELLMQEPDGSLRPDGREMAGFNKATGALAHRE